MSEGFEPEVRRFLQKIMFALFVVLLWMGINVAAGIMYGHAFFEDHIRTGNIIYYAWFLVSLSALIWFIIRLWRSKP
jgi:hypothetical protein